MGENYSMQLLLVAMLIVSTKTQPISNCATECGNVTIPFPFGITEECSLSTSFLITCNRTTSPHTPFLLNYPHVSVLNISLDGELNVSLPVAMDCYNSKARKYVHETFWGLDLTPFHLSPSRNELTVVGVDTAGILLPLSTTMSNTYTAPLCLSLYDNDLVINGSCYGIGCCATTIKQGISHFSYYSSIDIINSTYYNSLFNSYPCGYAFLVAKEAYNFSTTDLVKFNVNAKFPVVLDWAVGNHTCQEARKDASSYACVSEHSECVDAKVGEHGYLCNCSHGFRGNAYLHAGCQDIDECKESKYCVPGAKCKNFPGSYHCTCPKGYEGDGQNNGTGCKFKPNNIQTLQLANPTTRKPNNTILIFGYSMFVGILALLGGSFYVYWALKKRKFIKLREKFFQQNGGLLLQQQIARHRGSNEMTKIFTEEELKVATNNFNKDRVLGQGGQGTVYKGVLLDNRIVAIKKSRVSNSVQIEQFINEVIVLSQINHKNVVKLLGCCLETEIPMLVYEFIPNGTVSEHLHGQNHSLKLTWKTRLRIASETAWALAYLHSAASNPIIHRDVKTTNILLDHNFKTKVSDFGASKISPLDQTQLTTLVQGTLGYLDPEYFLTSQLTEKSDVYSFGVVLAELLTRKKAFSFDGQESVRNNLAMYFISSMKEDRLLDIVDKHIIDEVKVEQLIEYASIAKQCLNVKREERPSMKEVAMKLEGLSVMEKHQWENVNLSYEETETLLKGTSSSFRVEDGTGGRDISSNIEILTQNSFSW